MFRSSKFVELEVECEEGPRLLKFYPASYATLTKFHALGACAAAAVDAFVTGGEDASRREKALASLLERLYADHELVGELILDSLRDEFQRPITKPKVREFVAEVDAPTLASMLLQGVAKANQEAFAPLVLGLAQAVGASRQSLEAVRSATSGQS